MCIDVGDSAGFKTFKNPVLTISDLSFAPFSDISVERIIFHLGFHIECSVHLPISKDRVAFQVH